MTDRSPFHQGEIDIQKLTGEQLIADKLSPYIRDVIPDGAFDFICQQVFIWIGIEDEKGFLWAFPLFGSPGFINPNKGRLLEIHLENNFSIPVQWRNALQKGKAIGCLVIDLSTRHRIRINGVIRECNENNLQIEIKQSYPNCPKYIRKRKIQNDFFSSEFIFKTSGIELTEQAKNIITYSDTAFVASLAKNEADVSHRGGASGFIKCIATNKILVPDYKGNSLFNTLGNFQVNPKAGLTIVDYAQGYYLQIFGKTNIVFDSDPRILNTGGSNRHWTLEINKWYLFKLKNSCKWNEFDFSPYNP